MLIPELPISSNPNLKNMHNKKLKLRKFMIVLGHPLQMSKQFRRIQELQKVGFNVTKTMYLIMSILSQVETEGLTLTMKLLRHGKG